MKYVARHTDTHPNTHTHRDRKRRLQMHFLYVIYRQMSDDDDDDVAGGDNDKPGVADGGRRQRQCGG